VKKCRQIDDLLETVDVKSKPGSLGTHANSTDHGDNKAQGTPIASDTEQFVESITLSNVQILIDEKSIREMPGNVPFAVDEYLTKLFASQWEDICLNSFESMKNDFMELVSHICKTHFKRFQTSGLAFVVRSLRSI
jgi:hypothetical protein